MWKKWLNIFLCIWLVNSVTYFHAANPFADDAEDQSSVFISIHPKLNTWIDCLLHQASVDDDSTPLLPHKIISHRRYVNSRPHSFSNFIPGIVNASLFFAPQYFISHCNCNYSIGVAMLPAYYNFLFRFSPF